ncbi:MAG: hypothetical protein JO267_15545 [Alphaproteobacteria bacterium]|nr:hypothetical protein [Alphaproteobacteria bacterium]
MSCDGSLTALRARIRRIEQPEPHGVLPFGVAAIDEALSGGGLALGAVHEILGYAGDEEDGAAAAGFIAGIAGRLGTGNGTKPSPLVSVSPPGKPSPPAGGRGKGEGGSGGTCLFPLTPTLSPRRGEREDKDGEGPIVWCLPRPDLYGPGLQGHGLDPARLVLVTAPRREDMLWAMEEGLRAPGIAAVIGELGQWPMVASRRLQLAAERSGVTAFVLRRWRSGGQATRERDPQASLGPSAAATRWRIAALPSCPMPGEPGIGVPRWRIELLRCRGGRPGCWEMEAADATGHVSVPAMLADRPAAPRRASAASGPIPAPAVTDQTFPSPAWPAARRRAG